MEYKYIKEVNVESLISEILQTSIHDSITSISVSCNLLKITTNKIFSKKEALCLSNIVSNHISYECDNNKNMTLLESKEILLAKNKREFGVTLVSYCIDQLGAKNKILLRSSSEIVAVLSALLPIKNLLETGALGTARTALSQLVYINRYPDYSQIFRDVIAKINNFEKEYGI